MAQGLGAPREAYCVLDSEERDYLVGVGRRRSRFRYDS